jgi:hypothetical protein
VPAGPVEDQHQRGVRAGRELPGASSRAKRSRNTAMLAVVASGRASAKASSVPGRQAANR